MFLLFVLVQVQVIGLLVIGVALGLNLAKSASETCKRNSARIDGTHSKRREAIECKSINHATMSIYSGLATIFLLTSVVGLVATGICYFVVGLDLEPIEVSEGRVGIENTMDWAIVSFLNFWQWPLVVCYSIFSFLVFPPYISYLYRDAIDRYHAHANARFQQYYQLDWWNESKHRLPRSKKSESPMQSRVNTM